MLKHSMKVNASKSKQNSGMRKPKLYKRWLRVLGKSDRAIKLITEVANINLFFGFAIRWRRVEAGISV